MEDRPISDQEQVGEHLDRLLRIRTVFTDDHLLQKIGEHLQRVHLITGFQIREIKSGYVHKGKQHSEKQFELNILVPMTIDAGKKSSIYSYIETKISEKWDVPMIEEAPTTVNGAMRLFVEGMKDESGKLRKLRRNVRRAIYGLLGLAALGSTIGGTALVVNQQRAGEVKRERQNIYKEISDLERKMEEMTRELNRKLVLGEKLTIEDGGEFGVQSVEEINQIRDEVRKLEFSIRKLKEKE